MAVVNPTISDGSVGGKGSLADLGCHAGLPDSWDQNP